MKPIHCPYCNKKLGEHLEGLFIATCPRCHTMMKIDRRIPVAVAS